jgi:Lamin Tail Domain/IPT/TIG domain
MRNYLRLILACLGLAAAGLCLAAAHVTASRHTVILMTPQQSPQAATLVINEYLADPPDGLAGDANGDGTRDGTQDEFVELVNFGASPLSIGGFTISDSTQVRYTIPANKIIPPHESAVIFGGGTPTGDFGNAAANDLVFVVGTSQGLSLNNGGDTITVKDNTGVTVDSVTYGSSEGNANQSITRSPDVTGGFARHSTAPGSGGALFSPGARINGGAFTTTDPVINAISPDVIVAGIAGVELAVTGSNFLPTSKVRVDGNVVATTFVNTAELDALVPAPLISVAGAHAVTVENPGPVVSNPVTLTVLAAVGINEYLADPPDGLIGDANGDGVRDSSDDEFIEVVNRTDAPISIGGYALRDADAVRFRFPPGTIIPAGEAAVVFGGGTPTGDFGNARANGLVFKAASLSLNNSGDTLSLLDAAGQIVESFTYGATEGGANQSINRNPEFVGAFVKHSSIQGSSGRLFSPGTQVGGAPFTAAPHIIGITPESAPLGAPPFDLTIRGSDFESTSRAFIDGNVVSTSFVSPGELMARVPASTTSVAGAHTIQVRHESGNRSNLAVLTIIPPPPHLIEVLPRVIQQGSANYLLFVRGEHFDAASAVFVEGTVVTTTFTNATELRATVPGNFAADLGTRRVRVRNGDGAESNELSFEVVATGTRITGLTPAQVTAGDPAFTLTVAGAGFKSGAVVLFDDAPLTTTLISASQVRAEVPASLVAAPGLHVVQERNGDGGMSNQLVFFVLPRPPLAKAIDPAFVIEGAGDVAVTITGERFARGAAARLLVNNQPGARLDTTFVSSEQLTIMVPAQFTAAAGALTIQVINPDFGVSNTVTLRVFIRDPLVINEYLADPPGSAATDLIGDANGDGARSSSQDEFVEIVNRTAETMDVSGFKLSDADAVRHVFAAGTVVPPFEAIVVFGGGKPRGRFGNATENHLVFTASTGGLSLNNGGDTITLTDAQGRIIQQIKYGAAEGGAGQSLNRDPDGDGATFALHTQAAHDLSRLFSPGTRAAGESFSIKPTIENLTPARVHLGSAATLAVTGSQFAPGASVLLGNAELATTFRSASLLEAEVTVALAAEAGALEVRVRNPRGETSSAATLVVFDDPPQLARLTPAQTGTGAEDLELMIEGERFERGAVALVGGQMLATDFVAKTTLRLILPASLFTRAGPISVQVTNADGNFSNTLSIAVDYGPLITRLSRKRIRAGTGEVDLNIGGVAFKPDVILFVNDVAVPTTFVSETTFTARLPAGVTAQAGKLTLQARHADGGRSNRATLRVE